MHDPAGPDYPVDPRCQLRNRIFLGTAAVQRRSLGPGGPLGSKCQEEKQGSGLCSTASVRYEGAEAMICVMQLPTLL